MVEAEAITKLMARVRKALNDDDEFRAWFFQGRRSLQGLEAFLSTGDENAQRLYNAWMGMMANLDADILAKGLRNQGLQVVQMSTEDAIRMLEQ